MLIDSDVLVWMTRGHTGAVQRLAQLLPWQVSAVTYIELAQGCRTKAELAQIKKGLAKEQGPLFSLTAHNRNSIAKQILDLLGWSTYANYLQDMQVILP